MLLQNCFAAITSSFLTKILSFSGSPEDSAGFWFQMRNIAKVVAQIQLACEHRTFSDAEDEIKVPFFVVGLIFCFHCSLMLIQLLSLLLRVGVSSWLSNFSWYWQVFIKKRPLQDILTHHCLWCKHCNSKIQLPSIALEAVPGNYFMKVYLLVVGIAVLQFIPQQLFCTLP